MWLLFAQVLGLFHPAKPLVQAVLPVLHPYRSISSQGPSPEPPAMWVPIVQGRAIEACSLIPFKDMTIQQYIDANNRIARLHKKACDEAVFAAKEIAKEIAEKISE